MNRAPENLRTAHSFYEATARQRVAQLLDAGSFGEILGPRARLTSPHLPKLDAPCALDDGVVIGSGRLDGREVLIAAEEGSYMGGAVGEVHGAKIVGLLQRAIRLRANDEGVAANGSNARCPQAVLLLIDSGGVRLHEANAGLIAIAEIMRGVLDARVAGVPVVGLIGGATGAFGGMGIVAHLCTAVVMSEEGRLALSGPEVIETAAGVEEFDSRDRALVWRVTGGKHRYLIGDCGAIVGDDIAAFRQATIAMLRTMSATPLNRERLQTRQALLAQRRERFAGMRDGLDVWKALGIQDPVMVPMLETDEFTRISQAARASVDAGRDAKVEIRATAECQASENGLAHGDASRLEATLTALFPGGNDIAVNRQLISGTGQTLAGPITVLGTSGPAAIGARLALALAEGVLGTIERHPARPILFLVNTSGQALSRHEELIGLNGYLAHLASCIDLARRQGHPTLSLVYGEAVSGGYLSFGLMADRAYALADAQVRVMELRAMARITKIPLDRLVSLAQESPVFAPGVENYQRMGAIHAIWHEPSPAVLQSAIEDSRSKRRLRERDDRSSIGLERGGRTHARPTAEAVSAAD